MAEQAAVNRWVVGSNPTGGAISIMKLTILIPCYNESQTIQALLQRVLSVPLALEKEILVIDDASTDGSAELLRGVSDVHLVVHPQNAGKGAAIQTGLRHATGDFLIIQDADMEYSPQEYPMLLEPLLLGEADVVYGSRFLHTELPVLYRWSLFGLANRFLTWFSNRFTGLALTDMETCYKVMSRQIYTALRLEENRFGIEPEITAKLARLTSRIVERPITYTPRTKSQGKKIGIKDGISALRCILKYKK